MLRLYINNISYPYKYRDIWRGPTRVYSQLPFWRLSHGNVCRSNKTCLIDSLYGNWKRNKVAATVKSGSRCRRNTRVRKDIGKILMSCTVNFLTRITLTMFMSMMQLYCFHRITMVVSFLWLVGLVKVHAWNEPERFCHVGRVESCSDHVTTRLSKVRHVYRSWNCLWAANHFYMIICWIIMNPLVCVIWLIVGSFARVKYWHIFSSCSYASPWDVLHFYEKLRNTRWTIQRPVAIAAAEEKAWALPSPAWARRISCECVLRSKRIGREKTVGRWEKTERRQGGVHFWL